eukprot:3451625-Amphidinium_carterae.1
MSTQQAQAILALDKMCQKTDRLTGAELFAEIKNQAARLGMTVPQGHPHMGKQMGSQQSAEGWQTVPKGKKSQQQPAQAGAATSNRKKGTQSSARPLLEGLRLVHGQFSAPERTALTGLVPGVCLTENEQEAASIWKTHRRDVVSQAIVLPHVPQWDRAVYAEATVQLEADDPSQPGGPPTRLSTTAYVVPISGAP